MVGEQAVLDLDLFRPNTWNPNQLTKAQQTALRHGLETLGWVSSQAMLVWHTDEAGKVQNIIIDGEHRWAEARALGFKQGPVVLMKGLTEAAAKAFTIKLDGRRGSFDWTRLAPLVAELDLKDASLQLGFSEAQIARLLEAARPPELTSQNVHAKIVPLFFDATGYERFNARVAQLAKHFGTDNVTSTVLAAIQHADAHPAS